MIILLVFSIVFPLSFASLSQIHYPISRRSGNFPAPETANLTYLLEQLEIVESRFDAATRGIQGSTVARKAKKVHETEGSTVLLGQVGRDGNWFGDLKIGQPAKRIDMDLDMLSADWWISSTSGKKGAMFWDSNSKTYIDPEVPINIPACRGSKDVIHFPMIKEPVPITFPYCRPATQLIQTLLPSGGAHLGLAPSHALSQTHPKSLIPQLLDSNAINAPIWSILLVSGKDGILTIGGMAAATLDQVGEQSNDASTRLTHGEIKRSSDTELKNDLLVEEDWKWSKVSGANGWWQISMDGVWVDRIKILHNQPVILDVNTPFIIAPPSGARAFYASISGSKQLDPPYDQFYAYPCFNRPKIHFEFAGWNVEMMKGKRGDGRWSPGGAFSLGRKVIGSGYCIGMIIESRWDVDAHETKKRRPSWRTESESGLEDLWIIGEPFFRDVQVAFDWKEQMVGMQKI